MKALVTGIILTVLSASAFADTLTCTLQDSRNRSNISEVTVDLRKALPDYIQDNGLDIGEENYSYTIEFSGDKSALDLNVVFTENNNVQDEVSSGLWTVDLTSAKNGEILLTEELGNDGKKIMDFSCQYRK
jgi:hypothetical protein